jgi:hypothetical protein
MVVQHACVSSSARLQGDLPRGAPTGAAHAPRSVPRLAVPSRYDELPERHARVTRRQKRGGAKPHDMPRREDRLQCMPSIRGLQPLLTLGRQYQPPHSPVEVPLLPLVLPAAFPVAAPLLPFVSSVPVPAPCFSPRRRPVLLPVIRPVPVVVHGNAEDGPRHPLHGNDRPCLDASLTHTP